MKVAEFRVTYFGGSFGGACGFAAVVGFDDLAAAKQRYDEIAELLKARAEDKRGNGTPQIVQIKGINEFNVPLENIVGIELADLKWADENEIGIKDAFPHLDWK